MAKLDEALQASAGASSLTQAQIAEAQARERSLSHRLDAAIADTKALAERLVAQEQQAQSTNALRDAAVARQRELLTQAELRLDELATLAHDMAARGDADSDKLAASATLAAATAERLAQSEQHMDQRLEQIAAQMRATADMQGALRQDIADGMIQSKTLAERLSQSEQRLEQTAAQMRATADMQGALLQDVADGMAQSKTLTERLSQGEQRLDQLTTQLPERMARLESRMDELARMARSAMELAAQSDIRSNGKVAFTTRLTEDKTLYPLNLQVVGSKDRAVLDALVKRVKALGKDYHLEIQGHTDNTSGDDYNYHLGKARAEVMKRYLHETGGIPLSWMSVISYGATQPLDPQSNSNRRIVIQTLVLDGDK
ncbi:MAG: OmpA family protein [Hydrogenophilales bacterium]|nr:OmpA family protein [Hydrogenophilales bacterium]